MSQILEEKKDNPLAPGQMKDGAGKTVASSSLLQLYTNTILLTPDIHLPKQVDTDSQSTVSTDLPKHQATARQNAQHYIDDVNPLMVGTLADIIGYSNQWKAFYGHLFDLASKIDEGDNAKQFSKGLTILQNTIKKKSENTQKVIDELNGFAEKIKTDSVNFTEDHQHVATALDGEGGEIESLKKQLGSINDAINKDNELIAGGAVGDIVGVLMISVGILGEFESGGTSTSLIVGGLGVIGTSSTGIGLAAKDLSEKRKELKEVTVELQNLQQLYTTVNTMDATINTLKNSVANAILAVTTLQQNWNSLHADLDQVKEALDPDTLTSDLGDWLVNSLEAANNDWNDTHDYAVALQANGTLPVKKEDMTGNIPKIAI